MRITYYPETDSLSIDFKPDYRGPGHGADVTPDGLMTAHYSADRELVSVEIEAEASKLIELSRLEVEGCRSACPKADRRRAKWAEKPSYRAGF